MVKCRLKARADQDVGLRSSTTTDKAFQHLIAPPVITKFVFKLKMVGVNF